MATIGSLVVKIGADLSSLEQGLNRSEGLISRSATNMRRAGTTLTTHVTAPLLAVGGVVAKIGMDFESSFTGVIKTVDATDEQIARLRTGIRDMAKELPASANEIASVAESAGQLGIATDNILGFTRTVIDLSETTNLSTESAAQDLARLANITGMAQADFNRLGSTVVGLGNNLATTESDIVAMGMRIAGAGTQVGLSTAEILGLAGALSSVGIEAEAGGSAISRVMIEMANAVANGGEELQQFARVAGMSGGAFATLFETDAAGALVAFISGLDDLSKSGENVFAVLDEMGLSEIRVRDALLRAAGASDLFAGAIDLANTSWDENIALTREAELRYGTAESKLKIMINRFKDLGIAFYSLVQPGWNASIDAASAFALRLTKLADGLESVDPKLVQLGLGLAVLAAAAGPLLITLGLMASGVAAAGAALGLLATPLGLVAVAFGAAAAGVAALKVAAGEGPIVSETTLQAIRSWPEPLQSLAGWALGAGAALEILWGALTAPDDVEPARLIELYSLVEQTFGEGVASRIGEAAVALIGLGAAIRILWGAFTQPEGMEPNQLFDLYAKVENVFGEDAATRLGQVAGSLAKLSAALGKIGPALDNLDSATRIDGIFSEAAAAAIGMFPEPLQRVATWVWAAAGGLAFLSLTLAGFPDTTTATSGLEAFAAVFGETAGTNLSNAAASVGKLATNLQTLATTGDLGPLATQLGALKDAAVGLANTQIGQFKIVLADQLDMTGLAQKLNLDEYVTLDLAGRIEAELAKVRKISIGDLFEGSLQLKTGQITAAFGGKDFAFDLGAVVAKGNLAITGLASELSAAFETEGWSGLAALGRAKVAELGTALSEAVSGLYTNSMVGLTVAGVALQMEVNQGLQTAESFVDLGAVRDWIGRSTAAAKAEVARLLTGDNLIARSIERGKSAWTEITAGFEGFGELAWVERFQRVMQALGTALSAYGEIKFDVIETGVNLLVGIGTKLASLAATGIDKIDGDTVANAITSFVSGWSKMAQALSDEGNAEKVGAAVGNLASTLITKLGEVLGSEDFGAQVGDQVGKAGAALATGAFTLAESVADELAKVDWAQFGGQMKTFVTGFIGAFFQALWDGLKDQTIFGQRGRDAMAEMQGGGILDAILRDMGLGFLFGVGKQPKAEEQATPFSWDEQIPDLKWDEHVPAVEWLNYVPEVQWGNYLSTVEWATYVPDISWSSFVPDLSWWNFIPRIDWGAFIPSLFGGGGGAGGLRSGGNDVVGPQQGEQPRRTIPGNAMGTSYWRGGLTWVGEEGPELVNLPAGSRIYDATESRGMMEGGQAAAIHIHMDGLVIRGDMDLEALAYDLARRIDRHRRR